MIKGEDIALVTNTVNRVLLCMDNEALNKEGEGFAACFTEDGKCEVKIMNAVSEGREQLKALGYGLYTKFQPAMHLEGNVVVEATEVDGEVRNTSYWQAFKDGECISYGVHNDVLVKVGAEYKIKSRIITHTWTKPK